MFSKRSFSKKNKLEVRGSCRISLSFQFSVLHILLHSIHTYLPVQLVANLHKEMPHQTHTHFLCVQLINMCVCVCVCVCVSARVHTFLTKVPGSTFFFQHGSH